MEPCAVFVTGEGVDLAWAVSDWPSSWRAIDSCYRDLEDPAAPLAWVVSMTEGGGPVTALRLMDASMWEAVAEDWRALRAYLMLGDLTPDFLHPPPPPATRVGALGAGSGRSPGKQAVQAVKAEAGVPGRATLKTPSGSDR